MSVDKVIEKLAKIKAHEESARKIGSTEEAEAFATMLQRLLLKHRLEMSDLEIAEEDREEPIAQASIDYQDVKVRRTRVAWMEKLARIVAEAHYCRIVIHSGSSRVSLVGRPSNTKVAGYLIVVLTRSAERISYLAYRRWYSEVHAPGETIPMSSHGFRTAFLESFITRLQERLEQGRAAAEASTCTALVRLNRDEDAIRDFLNGPGYRKAAIVRGARADHHAEGHRRGREAADGVNLQANAVQQGSTPSGRLRSGS